MLLLLQCLVGLLGLCEPAGSSIDLASFFVFLLLLLLVVPVVVGSAPSFSTDVYTPRALRWHDLLYPNKAAFRVFLLQHFFLPFS